MMKFFSTKNFSKRRKKYVHLFTLLFFIIPLISNAQNKKIAQTGFQFLTVGTDARSTALGEAFTTVENGSNSLFYNPAGMASANTFLDVSFNSMGWIADINYLSGTIGLNIEDGKYGVFGLSFLNVDYGDFLFTRVSNSESGYEDITTGVSKPYAFSVGVGYAIQLSQKFSVGGQIKYVKQSLGTSDVPVYEGIGNVVGVEQKQYELSVLAFDFGTIYRTGFKSLVFGMSVRNFSEEVKYEKEGFQLPLSFRIGISIDAFDFIESVGSEHSLLVVADAVHPRSFPEYLSFGGEYVFMNLLSLRAGYVFGQDLYDFTAGFGIRKFGFELNYSFTPYFEFKDIHRFSVAFSL
jgi:hypothetical protein